MRKADQIVRCVLDPKYFQSGDLLPAALFKLEKVDDRNERSVISVSYDLLFSNDAERHAYGRRVATVANAASAHNKGRDLAEDEISRYLCHYNIRYSELQGRCWDFHSIFFCWRKEGTLREHCEIEVAWNGRTDCTKAERRQERTDIVLWLWEISFGPQIDPLADVSRVALPVIAERVACA